MLQLCLDESTAVLRVCSKRSVGWEFELLGVVHAKTLISTVGPGLYMIWLFTSLLLKTGPQQQDCLMHYNSGVLTS